mmetsp:Transcript_28073/g.21006  ORF Transcript_28073/g.21006 Transcript_28073/m.21006 type:complete len:97 (+) Transcript_28073:241-531(+)
MNVILSIQCEGAIAAILPTHSLNYFGLARGKLTYAFMYSCIGLSSFSGSLLVKYVQDYIGYEGMFIISLALTALATAIWWFIGDKKFDYESRIDQI